MRITNVIREFMNEELTKKRLAANAADRADYEAARKECEAEVQELYTLFCEQVSMTLQKHNMSREVKRWGEFVPATEQIIPFNYQFICNTDSDKYFSERESERFQRQKEAMKSIELEMALGGAKDDLMRMLNAIQF